MANSSPLNDFNTTSGIHRPLSLEYQTLGGEKKTEPKAFRAIANGEWSKPQWVGRLLNNRHENPGSARENVAYVIPRCTCVPSASQKKNKPKGRGKTREIVPAAKLPSPRVPRRVIKSKFVLSRVAEGKAKNQRKKEKGRLNKDREMGTW